MLEISDLKRERAALRLYISRAVGCRESDFWAQSTSRHHPVKFLHHIYGYFVQELELDMASAADELQLGRIVFNAFPTYTENQLDKNDRRANIYVIAVRRIAEQLSNPEKTFSYGPLIASIRSRNRDRTSENLSIVPFSCKFKSEHGYINHRGEIILRP